MKDFVFDDLHIAINRKPSVGDYKLWMWIDVIVTCAIASTSLLGFFLNNNPLMLGIIVIVGAAIVFAHKMLEIDYNSHDYYLAGLYARRMFDDYYDNDWIIMYRRALDAWENGDGGPRFSYLPIYDLEINRTLLVHFGIAVITIVIGYIGETDPSLLMITGIMQLGQGVIIFRVLQNLLRASFIDAYVYEFKRPRF